MKKIPILLILIALTFSGTSVAGDKDEDTGYVYRCRIYYMQQTPSVPAKPIKITTQSYSKHYCKRGSERLTSKILGWMSKNTNNIVTQFSEVIECKHRGDWSWGDYHDCKPKYRDDLINKLKETYPNQFHIDDNN
jgi:hypothetical protein